MKIATRFVKAVNIEADSSEFVRYGQVSLKELSKALEANLNVRSRLLAMANSAHAGRARRISKVSDALLVLGNDCVSEFLQTVSEPAIQTAALQ